jgi:gluconokinase
MSTVLDETLLEDRPEIDISVLAASLRPETEQPVVLALDIGTSGVRAGLFNHRGDEIAGSQTSLTNDILDLANGADVDADALIQFILRAVDEAVARAESFVSGIDYVAVSCFWHSLLGSDDEGRATTPLFGWADTRATQAVTELQSRFDEKQVHPRTGARFHPSYWPAKLLWLRHELSEEFERTTQWVSLSDYLFLQLFGYETTSVSMASATGLFNQHTCDWDLDLMAGLGISIEQLPAIAEPGETFQGLFLDHAARWPLLAGAVWFPAIGDGAANNIGAACVDPGRAALMIGTSGALRVLYNGNPPATLPAELFCYRADRNRVVIGGALSDGGGLYRWMKDSLGLDYGDAELEARLRSMQPDAHGLTILPFWSGERATGWSGSAQGSISGLTTRTTPVDILRAGMEAVCYRFALLAQALDKVAPETKIVAAGNALQSSPLWTQMMADVLGRGIELAPIVEASSHGAALLALEAAGKIDSIEIIKNEATVAYEPDMKSHDRYAGAIERQQKLYQKLIGPDILL